MLELFLPLRAPPAGRRTGIAANPDAIDDTEREPASDAKSCQERETWIEPDLGANQRTDPDARRDPKDEPNANSSETFADCCTIHHALGDQW